MDMDAESLIVGDLKLLSKPSNPEQSSAHPQRFRSESGRAAWGVGSTPIQDSSVSRNKA